MNNGIAAAGIAQLLPPSSSREGYPHADSTMDRKFFAIRKSKLSQ